MTTEPVSALLMIHINMSFNDNGKQKVICIYISLGSKVIFKGPQGTLSVHCQLGNGSL